MLVMLSLILHFRNEDGNFPLREQTVTSVSILVSPEEGKNKSDAMMLLKYTVPFTRVFTKQVEPK